MHGAKSSSPAYTPLAYEKMLAVENDSPNDDQTHLSELQEELMPLDSVDKGYMKIENCCQVAGSESSRQSRN